VPFGSRPSLVGHPMPAVDMALAYNWVTGSLQTTTGLPRSALARCVGGVGLSTPGAGHRLSMLANHADLHSIQEGRLNHVRPRSRYDAFSKASRMFNSIPTFPGIDFGCGCLLSSCVYGLLETPWLPTTPRPYGNRRSVLAWSDWFRRLTYATSCRTSNLGTSAKCADALPGQEDLHGSP
jgi:hypothetical protein